MEEFVGFLYGILGFLAVLNPIFVIAILVYVKKVADSIPTKADPKNQPLRKQEPNYVYKDTNTTKK